MSPVTWESLTACATPECGGDARYAAPGRGHRRGCTHPLPESRRLGSLPKLFDVVERVRDADGQGRRTDTVTGNLKRAIARRDEMRRQGRPAYVTDAGGRRIEVSW